MEHVPKRTRERQADLNLEDSVRTESMSDMGYRPGGAYDLRNSDDTHYYYYYYYYLSLIHI